MLMPFWHKSCNKCYYKCRYACGRPNIAINGRKNNSQMVGLSLGYHIASSRHPFRIKCSHGRNWPWRTPSKISSTIFRLHCFPQQPLGPVRAGMASFCPKFLARLGTSAWDLTRRRMMIVVILIIIIIIMKTCRKWWWWWWWGGGGGRWRPTQKRQDRHFWHHGIH